MALVECNSLWGACELFSHDPTVSHYENCFYVPFAAHDSWGIFDSSKQIIDSSVNYRSPERHTSAQVLQTTLKMSDISKIYDGEDLFYAGRFNAHYGHFIINTLPRLWTFVRDRSERKKILCHDGSIPQHWFNLPFIAVILNALELTADDFVVLSEPTRIRKLEIPRTSFGEQAYAHDVFGLLCRKIGISILGREPIRGEADPIYLSKAQLKSGVGKVVNEEEMHATLERAGVRIVYPEALSFRDQLALFAEPRAVLGTTGSAFHTGVFAPPRSRSICLTPIPDLNSNFALLDRLSGSDARYYFAEGTEVLQEPSNFITTFALPDPRQVAEDLLRVAKL